MCNIHLKTEKVRVDIIRGGQFTKIGLQYRRINGPGTIFQACLCPLSERFDIYKRNILGTSSRGIQMKYFIYIYFHKALQDVTSIGRKETKSRQLDTER